MAKTAEVNSLSRYIHVPGIFCDKDPSVPVDLHDRHIQFVTHIKRYSGYVVRNFTAIEEQLPTLLERFTSHVAPGQHFEMGRMPVPLVLYCKAVLIASMCRELFSHFESETFSSDAATFVISHEPSEQFARRMRAREQYNVIMGTDALALRGCDAPFRSWFQGVLHRLKTAWTATEADWTQTFIGSQELEKQVWEVGRQVWALHRLTQSFPLLPRLLRMPFGTIPTSQCCKSHYNEEAADVDVPAEEVDALRPVFTDGLTVFCTVIPGIQLDNFVFQADVLWF